MKGMSSAEKETFATGPCRRHKAARGMVHKSAIKHHEMHDMSRAYGEIGPLAAVPAYLSRVFLYQGGGVAQRSMPKLDLRLESAKQLSVFVYPGKTHCPQQARIAEFALSTLDRTCRSIIVIAAT